MLQDQDQDVSAHTTGPKATPVKGVKDPFSMKKVALVAIAVVIALAVYTQYFM